MRDLQQIKCSGGCGGQARDPPRPHRNRPRKQRRR
ncbi:unnamed protein product [Cuscuta europaea]|uniref:Uncharacterized protein n=1 Tax=Cuscuta europaea TaxID=41803 RepID=A0A9P0Z5A6_CUSEU|nr:unnamed protein product [Cuscuta europaea]CAH9087641.1 unnamed protein product [Cuscuta europaea]